VLLFGYLHRLFTDGLIEDLQQLFFVEDHLSAGHADDVVFGGQFDGVDRASLFAHAAVDAAQLVDLELDGVLLAIVPGAFARGDVDAAGGADGRAHHARDTLDPALLIAIEAVHAAEVALVETTLLDGHVFTPLLGVLHGAAGFALAEAGEEVAHGDAKTFDDFRHVDALEPVEGRGGDFDDVLFVDGHAST